MLSSKSNFTPKLLITPIERCQSGCMVWSGQAKNTIEIRQGSGVMRCLFVTGHLTQMGYLPRGELGQSRSGVVVAHSV
jgi:hypothetical protein